MAVVVVPATGEVPVDGVVKLGVSWSSGVPFGLVNSGCQGTHLVRSHAVVTSQSVDNSAAKHVERATQPSSIVVTVTLPESADAV
ncbi:unnamed protein product [Merluccius merluccius]